MVILNEKMFQERDIYLKLYQTKKGVVVAVERVVKKEKRVNLMSGGA